MIDTRYKEFMLRRIHSLTGIAPMGAFLFEHFFTNSFGHQGEVVYNGKVEFLRTLPYVLFIEWGLIFLPFLFHIFYGLYIMYSGQVNVNNNPHPRNWLYMLQRVTAIIAMFFIFYHVISLRFWDHGADPNFYRIMTHKFENPAIVTFYVIGILSVVFHFANGLSTFCMTWGLTVTPHSQKLVGLACIGIGLILAGMALNSILGFKQAGFEPQQAGEAAKTVSMGLRMLAGAGA